MTPGLDPLTGTMALPLWAAGALAALLVISGAVAFVHAGREGLYGIVARAGLLAIGTVFGLFFFEATSQRDHASERRTLEARAGALADRAAAPGSPLACLDAMAGETVERSCERTLFASPEAMAAAVSHVTAQLSLFVDVSEFIRRGRADLEPVRAGLRRSIEADRFGLVAYVLATRDGCSVERCPIRGLFQDARRVNANLAQRTYETHVGHYSTAWSAPAPATTAQAPTAAIPGVTPGLPPSAAAYAQPRVPGPDVFFPTPDSIPPVNIMTTEPELPVTTGAARPQPRRQPPPESLQSPAPPQQSQSKQGTPSSKQSAPSPQSKKGAPMDLNAAARGAPPVSAQ